MSTTQTDPSRNINTIIPAAACLMLLTAGSVSVYGSGDVLPVVTSIAIVCILSLVIIMVIVKKTPS